MKIGIFTNNYLPNPYGVTGSIETFRRELEKRGHTVFIFAPHWKGYIDKNKRVFRFPSVDIEIKFRFPLALPYSWKMRKILKKIDLDIIHAQHPNLLGLVAIKWARKKRIPIVFTWHTMYDKYVNFVPFVPSKVAAGYIIRKAVKFANKVNTVIAPTDSIIPILKKWGVMNQKIIAIPTGVTEGEFENVDRKKIRAKYNIQDSETVLLLVSRLTAEKNVEFIFKSLKNVLKKEKIRFLVVGGGYLQKKLENFCAQKNVSDKVIFLSETKREEMKDYYAAGDIFVYASKSETQGMVITEAMYMGLPIVALSATGIDSLVLNNGNGFLLQESEKEFEEAVLKLIEDKNLRKEFSETSKKIAKMKFTATVCAERMIETYKEAIENYKKKK